MKDEEKIDNQYIYDTPTGIIEKEGKLFRGMTSYDKNRPLWVKVLIILFSLCLLVLPGIGLFVISITGMNSSPVNESYQYILLLIIGLIFFTGGVIAIYKNIKK